MRKTLSKERQIKLTQNTSQGEEFTMVCTHPFINRSH